MTERNAVPLPIQDVTPTTDALECIEAHASAGGSYRRYRHASKALGCDMTFGIFLPPQAADTPCPVVWWLSGLTCTDENFMQKAGAHRVATERGVILVCPDTSPRNTGIESDDDPLYLGAGAGFYLNATQAPWQAHYRMFDYVTEELPELIRQNFPVAERCSIMGHSMGGLGALVCGLRLRDRYCAISAFAPMAHPSSAPWGQAAFGAYLGNDPTLWLDYDPCVLVQEELSPADAIPILIDQGDADPYLDEQLCAEDFRDACLSANYPLTLRYQAGYDHSYFFVASFIEEHLHHHADALFKEDGTF